MTIGEIVLMKPHESPRINKNQFVAIRGLCGIGVLDEILEELRRRLTHYIKKNIVNELIKNSGLNSIHAASTVVVQTKVSLEIFTLMVYFDTIMHLSAENYQFTFHTFFWHKMLVDLRSTRVVHTMLSRLF